MKQAENALALSIGNRLRFYRRLKGLTQKQVQACLGKPALKLWEYENGKSLPSLQTLITLAELYGTDLNSICRLPRNGKESTITSPLN